MKIRTQLKAGSWTNHNEALRVRSALKAGTWSNHNEVLRVRSALKAGGPRLNHNEALRVRSALKAGGKKLANHNEALRCESKRPAISMRRQPRTTSRKADRLELLVVRAGLRAGRARRA